MKIVVFGAGGFIGGWLCEELANRLDVDVVPCVRHWSSAVRLARHGLEVVQVDLETITNDLSAISGADVVVNTSMPSPEREPELAVRLYSACAAAGVRKFIQFSSIAVYGKQTGNVDEDTPPAPSNAYGFGKVETETRLLKASAQTGVQLFILRPSVVYGPFSDIWTVHYARRIAIGNWRSLGWAGEGTCNVVHAQDVARAVILAAFAETTSKSHVLNINGPELVTWNDYISRFGDALGVCDRKCINALLFSLTARTVHGVRKFGSWAKRKGIQRPLQQSAPDLTARAQSIVDLYPMPDDLQQLRRKVHYSWERATRVIGFRPSMSLDEGLQQSAKWCHIHGVVEKAAATTKLVRSLAQDNQDRKNRSLTFRQNTQTPTTDYNPQKNVR